jgi:hypothetical protein
MRVADFGLLMKKIAVGVALTLVPLLILAGGLWVTRELLAHELDGR